MNYTIDLDGNLIEKAEEGAAALREEGAAASAARGEIDAFKSTVGALEASTRAAQGLAAALHSVSAARPAFSSATDQDFGKSKWDTSGTKVEEPKSKGSGDATKSAGKSADVLGAATKSAGGLASTIGKATVGLLAYGAALAGLHGARDLTNMAIGWRAMGQLQLLSWKASMDLRRSVAGVDAQPLVRAFTRLESNLSKSTVTGSALSGILTRGFNSVFGLVERLAPALEGAFQYGIIGALALEEAWIDLKIAAFPLTSAIGEVNSALSSVAWGESSDGGRIWGETIEWIGAGAREAAGGIRLLAAATKAVDFAFRASSMPAEERDKLFAKNREENDRADREDQHRREHGEVFKIESGKATRIDPNTGNPMENGKAIGDGLVKGMDASTSAVGAAGERLGNEAVQGARRGADAHSPSHKTEKLGGDIDEGAIVGMERDAGAVANTAARVLAPNVKARAPGSGGGAPGGGIQIGQLGPFHVEVRGGSSDSMRAQLLAMAPDLATEILRILTARTGLPVMGTT